MHVNQQSNKKKIQKWLTFCTCTSLRHHSPGRERSYLWRLCCRNTSGDLGCRTSIPSRREVFRLMLLSHKTSSEQHHDAGVYKRSTKSLLLVLLHQVMPALKPKLYPLARQEKEERRKKKEKVVKGGTPGSMDIG